MKKLRTIHLYLGCIFEAHNSYKDVFPEQFLKQFGIKDVEEIFDVTCEVKDAAEHLKKHMELHQERLRFSHGTLLLMITKHALHIRCDHKRKIFRFGDTNTGIFDFHKSDEPLKELFECFNDLLCLKYSDSTHIAGLQFMI